MIKMEEELKLGTL